MFLALELLDFSGIAGSGTAPVSVGVVVACVGVVAACVGVVAVRVGVVGTRDLENENDLVGLF